MQLQRNDWVTAGLKALSQDGIDAVRVEVIARKLNITRGSFYWHFKNRQELLDAMLQHWEDQQTSRLISYSNKGGSPYRKIMKLFNLTASLDYRLDAAIFVWARNDSSVQSSVEHVERTRINYMFEQLKEMGFSGKEAHFRAETIYLIYLGWIDWANRHSLSTEQANSFSKKVYGLLLGTEDKRKS